MDAAVSDFEREARPWARIGVVVLALFALGVVTVRVLAASVGDGDGDDGAATAGTGDVPGAADEQPAVPPTAGLPAPGGPPAGGTGPVAPDRHGVPEAAGLRLYAVDGGELVALDVATGLVQRSPIDHTGGPDGARHVFASQGRVLVWPVGDERGLAAVSVRSGRARGVEVLIESVDEVQRGWSLGNVVVRIGDRLAEVAGDGAFRWGPERPPPGVGDTLLGGLNQRAVLGNGTIGSWGPIDLDRPGPELVPEDGELVALAPDGPIWLAADGTLHLPGIDGDVVVEGPAGAGVRWPVIGASVAPNGLLALSLADADRPPELVLLDRTGRRNRTETGGEPPRHVLPAQLAVIRWSPDSRWVVASDRALQTLVVVRAGTGEMFELPTMPVDRPADYAVVRVSAESGLG